MSCEPEEEEVPCQNLGDAIEYILEVFEDYADEETGKICPDVFEKMLQDEFPDSECKKKIDEHGLEKLVPGIDKKGDGVDLKEFSKLIKFMITGKLCRKRGGDKGKCNRRRRPRRGGKGKGQCKAEEDE